MAKLGWIFALFSWNSETKAQTLSDVPFRTVEAKWNFEKGLENWAQATTDTMQVEIDPRDGQIHGTIIGQNPYLDSPLLELEVTERHYAVLRMAYDGQCNQGGLYLERTGARITPKTNPEAPFSNPIQIKFPIISDGVQHVYYIPIYQYVQGMISRVRLHPCLKSAKGGQTFHLDWIMMIKAPTVTKVRGCIDKYFEKSNLVEPKANISMITTLTNGIHPVFSTSFNDMTLPFATTYNCMAGDKIFIQGRNFGDGSLISINGSPCDRQPRISIPQLAKDVENEEVITCILPSNVPGDATLTILNEEYNGLSFTENMVAYAVPANISVAPMVSNVMAYSVDVSWNPPTSPWICLTITGYKISWAVRNSPSTNGSFTLGNVTTTTITGLKANTTYSLSIAAVVESQKNDYWKDVDMYGRRELLTSAIVGSSSPVLNFSTLSTDVIFPTFSASSTLNRSASHAATTLGPTGDIGGQGSFGLSLYGHAHIENCNATASCCDFDSTKSRCLFKCQGISTRNGFPLASLTEITNQSTASTSTMACGPTLRLTGSAPYQTGAVWYPRKLNVREGFDTTFEFRISNPSFHCKSMDDVATHCRQFELTEPILSPSRARGGDGLAFVIQNNNIDSLGRGGQDMGYGGIPNSLSVEFDTTYNPESLDPYENHISVQSRGYVQQNSAHHSYSLGSTSQISDLTAGTHKVHIRYVPNLDDDMPFAPHFQAAAYVSQFLAETRDESLIGIAWNSPGLGCLVIEIDGRVVLSVPLHLDQTLSLSGGRAYVGFTAATGSTAWQVHDILSWEINSLRVMPSSPVEYFKV